jgi:hypothetical protein
MAHMQRKRRITERENERCACEYLTIFRRNRFYERGGNPAAGLQPRSHGSGHCNEKINERIEADMQNQLAEFKLGRIVLHLLCACRGQNFPWHWRGILREISQGALLVSPASKCDATEGCFANETETDGHGNHGGSRTETMLASRPFSD